MLPNFLIIGAPRSGTTWMEKNLREHPEVFLPDSKELHFFDSQYEKGIGFYESFFSKADGHKAIGEATPDYLHGAYSTNDIPALIHKHLPNVRLIVSLRNPIERVYSRFWNSKARYEPNFQKTFKQQLKDSPEFISEGMYFDQLQRYYSLFGKENILVLLFDELVADPEAFMQKVYQFLGIREGVRSGWEHVKVNQAIGKGNLAKSKLLVYLSRLLTWLRCHNAARFVQDANSVDLEPMDKETRLRLHSIYYEQNCKLQELIGKDLSHWNKVDRQSVD